MFEILLVLVFIIGFVMQRGNDRRLRTMEREINRLTSQLAELQRAPPAVADVTATQATALAPADGETAEVQEQVAAPTDTAEATETTLPAADVVLPETIPPADDIPPQVAARELPNRESLESWLGARWAVWVGGLALAFGGIFLIKYSIESGLLSPAVRLVMAAIFGLALFAAGEVVRRRALPLEKDAFRNAMIPGVLTAAGAVTLFGVVYAAYAIYSFIGPTPAFFMLAIVGFATLGLSLLHGQALAGVGLLGSMLTPALISTDAPDIRALFAFLAISWLATVATARFRRWTIVPALANVGMAMWALAYVVQTPVIDPVPPTLALLVMLAGTIFLWPGKSFGEAAAIADTDDAPAAETDAAAAPVAVNRGWQPGPWERLFARPPAALTVTASLAAMLPELAMIAVPTPSTMDPAFTFAAVIATIAAFGAGRLYAALAAIFAALGTVAGMMLLAVTSLYPEVMGLAVVPGTTGTNYGTEIALCLGLGAMFVLFGFSFLYRHGRGEPQFSTLWCALAVVVPLIGAGLSFVNFGNLDRDWTHALYGIGLGLAYLAGAEWLSRRSDGESDGATVGWLVAGAFAAFVFALHCLTHDVQTIVGTAIIGFAFVVATRFRPWAMLPWAMAAACVLVLAQIAVDPTIVGVERLGTRPMFNVLAVGYGIPALLAAIAAFELRAWADLRIRNLLQALASLMVFLTIAILVRHAMNGGVLQGDVPTLSEQSIYTLLTIGASAVLMTLDFRSPSSVFRYGSMLAGILSMLTILGAHLLTLNPYFTGENTGRLPFLNLLLIGYLLPGIAYAGLAYYARNRRPIAYVTALAVAGAVLGFAWATLSVRRFWQGENLQDWKGFLQGETYSYSVVWLLIGVILLGLGSRFDAKSLRIASAVLVFLTVVKVFLIDMSNLEGVLRPISFIGLGIVLIGIGLFYQRILTSKGSGGPRREVTAEE
ncbi:DUF2339 domain-containing protein [Rhizobium sp. LjRoot30]|uniref:DUF2339 domain-containing protein n=1 Tax=Rhizobium sp. LjRoot30 TaxID=3342320 RepID=UPI003ECCC715